MADKSEPCAAPGGPPSERRGPKRGAFPTPKSEIEKAKRYVPDVDEDDGHPEMNPDPPTDVVDKEEG